MNDLLEYGRHWLLLARLVRLLDYRNHCVCSAHRTGVEGAWLQKAEYFGIDDCVVLLPVDFKLHTVNVGRENSVPASVGQVPQGPLDQRD